MLKTRRHFTLIEILVVIVIGAILLGMVVPAYKRMMTGNAVDHGASMVASYISMARTEACAKRKTVGVIFVGSSPTIPTEFDDPVESDDIVSHRAFRAAYLTYDGSNYIFDGWIPGSKWEVLPMGAFFLKNDDLNEKIRKSESDTTEIIENLLIFNYLGKLKNNATSLPTKEIAEGIVTQNDLPYTDNEAVIKKIDDNKLTISVNRYTGVSTISAPEE